MLSERKKKILEAVISENIKKPQAISSKDLHEKYFLDVSSATIRNELMALEEMGYLFQPHTSSGRVPTTQGFKKYISELMPERELTPEEITQLKENFASKINGLEDLAGVVAESLSSITNYASVVYVNNFLPAVIENIKIVRIGETEALVIVVTDLGVIKDLSIDTDPNLTDEDLITAGRFITEVMCGKVITDLNITEIEQEIKSLAHKYKKLFMLVIESITKRNQKPICKVEGASKLLSQPEYTSPEKARNTLKLFENKEVLAPLIETGNDLEISIKVGEDEKSDCSVVSATYKINGKNVGTAGIVGPVRMDYAKAVSVLKQVNNVIASEVSGFLPNGRTNKQKLKGDKHERRTNRTNWNKKQKETVG